MDAEIAGIFANEDEVGFKIRWCDNRYGFGEILIIRHSPRFNITIDSENMGKDFVKEVLNALVDKARLVK